MMKHNLIFTALLLAGLLALASGCPQSEKEPAQPSAVAPASTPATPVTPAPVVEANPALDFAFARFDGETGTLSDYYGKPLVVNFWATW